MGTDNLAPNTHALSTTSQHNYTNCLRCGALHVPPAPCAPDQRLLYYAKISPRDYCASCTVAALLRSISTLHMNIAKHGVENALASPTLRWGLLETLKRGGASLNYHEVDWAHVFVNWARGFPMRREKKRHPAQCLFCETRNCCLRIVNPDFTYDEVACGQHQAQLRAHADLVLRDALRCECNCPYLDAARNDLFPA